MKTGYWRTRSTIHRVSMIHVSRGRVLTDIVSLQQTRHNNPEVYPDRAAAPCSLQGNGQREIVNPVLTPETPTYSFKSQ